MVFINKFCKPLDTYLTDVIKEYNLSSLVTESLTGSIETTPFNINSFADIFYRKSTIRKHKGKHIVVQPSNNLLTRALIVYANTDRIERYVFYHTTVKKLKEDTTVAQPIKTVHIPSTTIAEVARTSNDLIQRIIATRNKLLRSQLYLTEKDVYLIYKSILLHGQDINKIILQVGIEKYEEYMSKSEIYISTHLHIIEALTAEVQRELSVMDMVTEDAVMCNV